MKINFKKIILRGLATLGFCIGLLALFIFNPSVLYGHQTKYKNFTIYHNQPIDNQFIELTSISFNSLETLEIFDRDVEIEICINDGSIYPPMIEKLMGMDMIRSFSNISVLHGKLCTDQPDCLQMENWGNQGFQLSQWLAHSFVHELQFHKQGLFGSNPIAQYPDWKWEGYAEYATLGQNKELSGLIEKHLAVKDQQSGWVMLDDLAQTTVRHFQYLIMTRYCLEIKKMNYDDFFANTISEENMYREMMEWYGRNSH